MITKIELADRILDAIKLLQREGLPLSTGSPLPELIPTGDGRSIVISGEVSRDISRFGRIVHANGEGLAASLSSADMDRMVRHAFGSTLASVDLDDNPIENRTKLLAGVNAFLQEELTATQANRAFVFGCWFIRDVPVDATIGPVRIERRHDWLTRMRDEHRVSIPMERRLRRHWAGKKLRRRKASHDAMWERDLLDSIGECPDICTVQTTGLGGKLAEQKAILAARLALTAIALLWGRPSKALEGFGLLLDGGLRRHHHISFGPQGWRASASRTGRMPGTTWVVASEWNPVWEGNAWLLGPVSEMLDAYLAPATPPRRPNATRVLFHALWWFYEACQAEVPLMAIVKFGAVLDTLAGGGGNAPILKLIEARLGHSPSDPITFDGKTTASLVREIYGAGRSGTIHGSNDQYGRDWSSMRDLAESLTRNCLAEVVGWLHTNPSEDDLARLRAKDGGARC